MAESTRFEMGKQYRGISSGQIYECLFAGNTHVVLSDGKNEFSASQIYRSSYTEVKLKRVFEEWVNLYDGAPSFHHPTKKLADYYAGARIACIHVRQEYEEGEGL